MTNKFVSFLEAVGRDFENGLSVVLPFIETAGEAAIATFVPALGPLFNQTVSAVVTAEQAAAAIGKQSGTGVQKAAAVVVLVGPLIEQALIDAGKPSDATAVQNYVNSIVAILNLAPAPVTAAAVA